MENAKSYLVEWAINYLKGKDAFFKKIESIEKGKNHIVSAKISGATKNGFLDLAIIDPDGTHHWFPDPQSYDSSYDNGNLSFDNGRYEAKWEFSLPDKSGKYISIMGLYENNGYL